VSRPDVALVSPYPPPGERHGGRSGVAPYAAQLAHALVDAGAEVCVVAPREEGEPARHLDGDVRVERPFVRGASALHRAAAAARITGAPAVHLQHETFLYGGPSSVPALGPALRSLRRARQGVVVTMHHVVDPGSVDAGFTAVHRVRAPWRVARAGLGRVQRTITRSADAVLVHEPGFADVVPDAHVVPHGIDVDPAAGEAAAARARLGLDERFTALCFGFLAPYKGLETALRAADIAGDGVHLVIAGGEHPRMAGDGYADGLRALGPATFTGPVPDAGVRDWFAAADVALFPYPRPHATSGPLALALGAGTPVLLSEALAACAGAPATLAVPADPVALGGRLATLAADEAARDALAAASAALARDRSWPHVAQRHLEVYAEVAR
jgi:glycosyltransferase involved in cell wall biosynthesis